MASHRAFVALQHRAFTAEVGRGWAAPRKTSRLFPEPDCKFLPVQSDFGRNNALAFVKVVCSQISYRVHFIFKVHNSIHVFSRSKLSIGRGFILEVKPPIKYVIDLVFNKHYKILISVEVIICVTYHLEGSLSY
jgi:hypothetical protein